MCATALRHEPATSPLDPDASTLPKLLLTSREAAALLGTSAEMLDTLGAPFIPIRGRGDGRRTHRRYSRPALLAWLADASALPVRTAIGQAR